MARLDPLLFERLRDHIEPSAARIQRAVGSHNHLRAQLDTGQFANRIQASYLSGSYSRGTAIHPIDDVDVIFLVDPNAWRQSFLERILNSAPKPEPDVILNSFATAVRSRYERSSVFLQRRSIRLDLAHISLDVVPAVADVSPNLIWVPDRKKGSWIKSGPLLHKANGEDINRRQSGLYKPLVKLLKYWNSSLPATAQVRSFTIETMAARIFQSNSLVSLGEGLERFFDFVLWRAGEIAKFRWTSSCGIDFSHQGLLVPDTAGTGGNVAANADRQRIERFVTHLRFGRKRMGEATAAATLHGAASRLRRLFRD